MTSIDEMDEFVNWDDAGAAMAASSAFPGAPGPSGPGLDLDEDPLNFNLALENVDEDDFSFHALEHFTANADAQLYANPAQAVTDASVDAAHGFPLAAADAVVDAARGASTGGRDHPADFWKTPDSPCLNCKLSGYDCRTIREGRFMVYCTSCVALGVACSFGNSLPAFSGNPWPMQGDHPDAIGNAIANGELLNSSSATDLLNMAQHASGDEAASAAAAAAASAAGPPPKIGARFSRDSVRILKNWLSTHNRHPYPSDEEKEMLQRQTGLNKTQITNWLANARRRGKVQPPRSTSPQVGNWSSSIDIPKRRGTPALEAMNPLQRWEHSPPEHEPAPFTAIARAVTASSSGVSSGLNSPFSLNYTDDGSGRSVCNQSSASSLGTSHGTSHSGSGSMGSAYSHNSRNSWGSFGSAPFNSRSHRRRRRRAAAPQAKESKRSLAAPLKTFQCTFCTDTFRTKHDWQRHEKSLHLSLERWVCAPDGPRAVSPESGRMCCVFCGLADPDDAHIEAHNHSACQERTLEERTFYRKDHLNQHLRLVHNVKFLDWSMKQWKVATPQIRSRCGFCGIVMDTWTIRVDHLAEHFKTGCSMADWKGDWGFEVPVLDMVENSIPPYLIHHERTSPLPYVATNSPPESPRNAYELIKLEMAFFGANYQEQHERPPTDEEMMIEGCRIIFASELLSLQGIATQKSWFRDLIMKSDELVQKARFGPLRGAAENRLFTLKINGKDNLFEACPMERQLKEFAVAKSLLGLTAMDDELQEEACHIVGRVEEVSTNPSEAVANWLLRLITSSTDWLADFRRRAHLPRSEDLQDSKMRSTDPRSIDSTVHSYSRLERELADFLSLQRAHGIEPSDEGLQRQARIIIYEFDDNWNQTAADNIPWLAAFRERHPPGGASPPSKGLASFSPEKPAAKLQSGPSPTDFKYGLDSNGNHVRPGPFYHNDANCYRRIEKELARWVSLTTSPNNPNHHVPTDEELQYQARWILYNDDDPWNQTAADNAEWLLRFKRGVGLIKEPGPGLPDGAAWALEQGGSGFAPPYIYPGKHFKPFDMDVQATKDSDSKPLTAVQSAANCYLESLSTRYPPPATIFCSREVESALVELVHQHVTNTGRLPTDAAMRARAAEVVGPNSHNPASDPTLLEKFKQWMRSKLPDAADANAAAEVGGAPLVGGVDLNMDMRIWDEQMDNIMQDMDFEFDAHDLTEEREDRGGVSLLGAGPAPGEEDPLNMISEACWDGLQETCD